MGIKKVNKLYNIVVSSNIFHLQPELCKSVHKCNFGEFLNFRNFWTNDVTDDVIGVVGSIFWVILRVYIYDVIISKFHQNRSVNKKSTGGGSKAFWTMFKKTALFSQGGIPNLDHDLKGGWHERCLTLTCVPLKTKTRLRVYYSLVECSQGVRQFSNIFTH